MSDTSKVVSCMKWVNHSLVYASRTLGYMIQSAEYADLGVSGPTTMVLKQMIIQHQHNWNNLGLTLIYHILYQFTLSILLHPKIR